MWLFLCVVFAFLLFLFCFFFAFFLVIVNVLIPLLHLLSKRDLSVPNFAFCPFFIEKKKNRYFFTALIYLSHSEKRKKHPPLFVLSHSLEMAD